MTTTHIVFLVFSFQAELAQNKNNMDLTSYEFMTEIIRFFWGGEEWGREECPLFVPSLVSDCHVHVLGMLTSELGNVTETVT